MPLETGFPFRYNKQRGIKFKDFLYVFTGFASPCNDFGGVASLFQWFSSGGDRGSRMLFAGEHGGGRNATAAKSLKWPDM